MRPNLDKSEKFQKQRQMWMKWRQRGKQRFALWFGVIGWGGFMIIFMACARMLFERERLDLPWVFISLVIWPIAGYFFGLRLWRSLDEKFDGRTGTPPSIIAN